MKKVILAPDSFKGTISSADICHIMEKAVKEVFPDCNTVKLPVADGGEGTVEAMLMAGGGSLIKETVLGPRFDEIESFYGMLADKKTAVIEMAAAAGLPMVKGRENPMDTTTFGVGQLIRAAAQSGAKKILVGLGGSCTNDGGCGAAAALGVRFTDKYGQIFIPCGGTLEEIAKIDISGAKKSLKGVRLRIMCDVDNPLCGENGAAHVFGPQKGADEEMIETLDRGLCHLGRLLDDYRLGVADMPGAGAAGGMGAGMMALLGAEMVSGIDGVLDAVGFENMLTDCDMVFTGEGRIDGQSLRGKVVFGICRRAARLGVPVCAVVGDAIDSQLENAREKGLCAVFTTNRRAVPMEQAKKTARQDLAAVMSNIMFFVKAVSP